jgi:hypothetical protein
MTSHAPSPSRHLAPALLGIGAALAASNWSLDPERARAWIAALALFACLALVLRLTRGSAGGGRARAAASLRNGVVFAALIVAVSLAATMARTLGLIDDGERPQRLAMAVVGAFFVFTGNALPKTLMPLSARQCGEATSQALQRFMGWTWVLMGLAFSAVWLALPIDAAKPVSIAAIAAGAIAVATRVVRARAMRRREA